MSIAHIARKQNWPGQDSSEPVGDDPPAEIEVDLPARLLRRVLALSRNVGPETSLDGFSQRLAALYADIGGFNFAVVYFFDASDDAFYAEAMFGVAADAWPEVLAVSIPKRVYDRATQRSFHAGGEAVLAEPDSLLEDREVAACFAPLFASLPASPADGLTARGSAPAVREKRRLYVTTLEAPGQGTIGFCVAGKRASTARLGTSTRAALELLARQGSTFIENIQLYWLQRESMALSSSLLTVASAIGTSDIDQLVERTLQVLPGLFGGQCAGLLYLDVKRVELRMLEPAASDGKLTSLTEVKLSPGKVEDLMPTLRGESPAALEVEEIARVLPERLVQARGLRSAMIIPLNLANRPGDALAVFWTENSHRFRKRDFDVAVGVRELVSVALANAQLLADATARAEQLSTLYRTGQMMSSSLDLGGMLRTIAAAAVQLTRSTLCLIYLIDQKSGLLEFVAGSGLTNGERQPASIRPGEGLLGRCALLGKPELVEDLELLGLPALPDLIRSAHLKSALLLPLIASGEVIGVLATGADVSRYFVSEHQELLQAFANQAAVAIERGRLYALELRRRELAELQQTMTHSLGSTLELGDVMRQVLHYAGSVLESDLSAVHVVSRGNIEAAVTLTRQGVLSEEQLYGAGALAEPLLGQMIASDSAIVVSDTAREPLWRPILGYESLRSWIGVPLLNDDDYVVFMDLFSVESGAYTMVEADSLSQFARQVSFAVRNARIYAREHEAKKRLEELDQLRTDFVSTVSHELRTPLTGIKGFVETLLTYWGQLDDDRKHHYLDRIYGASKRLQRLVQDLLFVSRVEGGTLPLTIRRVHLADLISSAVQEIKQKYRGQIIVLDVPEPLPMVLADADRVQQVLVNLMDNGVKYSPEGLEISVRCTVLPDAVVFSVVDHGPGIRPQDQPRLFTRFGKIDQVIRAGHVGTGLGLFIAKQLVEQMNGWISVNSVVGQGSEFSFSLPRADL